MSRSTLIALLVTAVSFFSSPAPAAPLKTPYDLYELGPLTGPELEAFGRSAGDWRVLHQERTRGATWLLLGLEEGKSLSEVPGAGRPGYLGRVREGERVILADPEERSRVRLEERGRSVQIAPSGSTVFITPETPDRLAAHAHHSFRVVERVQPAPIARDPAPRERFRRIVQRAMESGKAGTRTAEEVEAVRDRVSADSLEVMVRELAELPGGEKRSRYFARPETETISRLQIATRLEAALGPGSVTSQAFEVITEDTTLTVTNVIGTMRCGIPNAGAILVTAHYDAIGLRSDPVQLCKEGYHLPSSGCNCAGSDDEIDDDEDCEWDWRLHPAPGADDNATGIACMLESARVLAISDLPFEFDIVFVAFQAEELGLLGSAAFADSIVNVNQEIFGVFNMDMVGYNTQRNQMDIVANETSEWFADYVQSTALGFVPDLAVNKQVIFFARSDHASFWAVGIDAILVNEDIDVLYPQYHTFQDTWEATFPEVGRPDPEFQLELAGKLLVSTLARLAVQHEAPDLAIPAGELELVADSGDPRTESPMRLTASVHNFGTSSLTFEGVTTDSLSALVSFYDGDPNAGGVKIGEVQHRGFFPAGGVVPFEMLWTPPAGNEGFHEVVAVLTGLDAGYEFQEVTAGNNVAQVEVFLEGPSGSGPRLLSQYSFPNPIRGSVDDLHLYYELTRDATVAIQVFDMEAQLVGSFNATSLFIDDGNRAGTNDVRGDQFEWESPKGLASGIYFYTIRVSSLEGAVTDEAKGKFALVR